MYKQDWIGLKQLDEDGRLKFMAVEVRKHDILYPLK